MHDTWPGEIRTSEPDSNPVDTKGQETQRRPSTRWVDEPIWFMGSHWANTALNKKTWHNVTDAYAPGLGQNRRQLTTNYI